MSVWSCSQNQCRLDGDLVYPGEVLVNYRNFDATIRETDFTNHRAAIFNLNTSIVEEDQTLWDCYREDESECNAYPYRRYGVDLLHVSFKKHMLDSFQSGSTGAIPAVLGLSIRSVVATENALVLIGADANDGQGSALANTSDLSIININPTEGHRAKPVVFRGYRALPRELRGLSDAFGFRLGEQDAVLGRNRVKNAGLVYLPGDPPADNAGNGRQPLPDLPIERSDLYANSPVLPSDDQGHLLLVSSSHATAADGTMNVIRKLDLSDAYQEVDHDPQLMGAQGHVLNAGNQTFEGGCGSIQGPDGTVWLFNRVGATAYNPTTGEQLYGGNQVIFPGDANGLAVCTGAIYQEDGQWVMYAFNQAPIVSEDPIYKADLSEIMSGNVDAVALQDEYLEPYNFEGETRYPRYVAGLVRGRDLYFLEKNEPRSRYRNVVHRAEIGANGDLTFNPQRDLEGEYTGADLVMYGDPAMKVASFQGRPHLFIGNQNSITVYDLSQNEPQRVNYNQDGDGLQDDLSTFDSGISICAFATDPAQRRLYALPCSKSARQPKDQVNVPLVGGGSRQQSIERYRLVVLDLVNGDEEGRVSYDQSVNQGNGIDLVYTYLKQYIVDRGYSPGALPPIFLVVRPQLAVSYRSVFVIGKDAPDGLGSALGPLMDVAMYNIESGRGYIFRGWEYEGLNNASGPFGFRLGVLDGVEDEQLDGRRIKNGAVFFVPPTSNLCSSSQDCLPQFRCENQACVADENACFMDTDCNGSEICLDGSCSSEMAMGGMSETGGNEAGNSMMGGSQMGGNEAGNNMTGGSQSGGNQMGGNEAGNNMTGGSQSGGNQMGGNEAGNNMGGNEAGNNMTGGSQSGGNQMGGNEAGNQMGGNQMGGNMMEECTPNATRACHEGNVHTFDSCGNVGGLVEACRNGCLDAQCIEEEDFSCEPRRGVLNFFNLAEIQGRNEYSLDSTLSVSENDQVSCLSQTLSNRDRIFNFTPSRAGDWVLSATSSDFDTILELRSECLNVESALSCNDDVMRGNTNSEIQVTLEANQTYYVIVEEFRPARSSTFNLTARLNP